MDFNPERRHFLKGVMYAGAATVLGSTFGPPVYRSAWDAHGEQELARRTDRIQQHLRARYGVEVHVNFEPQNIRTILEERNGGITMEEISSPYLRFKAMEGLSGMLAFYPPDLITKSMKEIYLVDQVTTEPTMFTDGTSQQGIAFSGEREGIVIEGAMVLQDWFAVAGMYLPGRTTHHELAHKMLEDVTEVEWTQLSPGSGYLGPFWQTEYPTYDDVPEHFVSGYATSDWKEDVACTSQELIQNHDSVMQRCRTDEILKRKVEFIKQRYERLTNGRMSEEYWKNIANRRVNESYWERE